jgi:hypothetical protein
MTDADSLTRVYEQTKDKVIGIFLHDTVISNLPCAGLTIRQGFVAVERDEVITTGAGAWAENPSTVIGTLLVGYKNDIGNVKGFLKKTGKEIGQQFVLYKPATQTTAFLINIADTYAPMLELGEWHPNKMPVYYSKMTDGAILTDYNFVNGKSFSSRMESLY